ncbi:MAG TPA: PVC-type heme-binding CxxCH protein [Humisphaera sp.]
MKPFRPAARVLLSLLPAVTVLPASAGAQETPKDAAVGVLPAGPDGKPLNLDFETGTLKDWTAEGEAFAKCPIKGDTVFARGRGMRSNHQGDYWVGGYEKEVGDDATGTLTSAPFKVTQRWATFRVAGGHWPQTRVELLTAADGKAFFKASGTDHETLRQVLVDLEKVQGQEIRIRLVDERKGAWGHVNFDDFRFHAEKPTLAAPPPDVAAAKGPPAGPADQFKFAGLSAADAAKAMTLPPGFKATVFAAEPDIINPIAFTIDAKGRLWVVQSLTYPKRAADGEGKDSIFVFEDTDGDGKFDKKTVFAEKLNLVSGIEVGYGGVWVGAAPYLQFIPYAEGADGTPKVSGETVTLLDGWGYQDTHETLNSFTWGPDGWLYGCHGVFTNSFVGKPGTPKEQRTHINAGIWRYHPTRHVFERFAEGTSNPWGMDFDEKGQLFIEACVIPHLWHIVQNARYQRQAGQHDNPYTFDDIKQIGDHVHYQGATPHSGNGRSDSAGGGHAHSGMMCYLGDNWPAEYRGKLFMNNIHGARINMDVPEPQGSGFVGRHGKDFLLANDRASQIMAMKYGPDGGVYVIDWYDLNQCHNNNPGAHDRTTGRIFKVTYGDVKPAKVDLEKMTDAELAGLLSHKNEWYPRTARRVLAERAATARAKNAQLIDPGVAASLTATFGTATDPTLRLRAMWTLDAIGLLDREQLAHTAMSADDPHVAGWAVRLMCERPLPENPQLEGRVWQMVAGHAGQSPVSQLFLAGAAHRLPADYRLLVAHALVTREGNGEDHNLPLMCWYLLESAVAEQPERALNTASVARLPNILAFTARRMSAGGGPKEMDLLVDSLAHPAVPEPTKREILRGMAMGLKGRRGVPAPAKWSDAVASVSGGKEFEASAGFVRELNVIFGSKAALAEMAKTALDRAAKPADRLAAIDSLLAAKAPGAAGTLLQLVGDPAVRAAAIRGLGQFDEPQIPEAVLNAYASLSAAEKKDAVGTLSGRPAYAKALLSAVGAGRVPKGDVTPDVVRQIRGLKDADVTALAEKVWGSVNETEKDKLAKIAKYKALVTNAGAEPSASRGRALFAKTCAQCHTLFNEGGKVGPDITGSDRANLDYLLLHVVDPNAVIPAEYTAWTLRTKDDRTVMGLLKRDDAQGVTLLTPTETVTVARADVAKLVQSPVSMMPEGLLDALKPEELRDLVAYLRSPAQVPVMADPDSAKLLFNGKDLTGWEALEEGLFSVEDGAIVGRTKTGLKKNQFLTSKLSVRDFRLVLKIKLTPDAANSGIQFRSVRLPGSHEMKGCQADAGKGWWGKLYEESGRGLLFPPKGKEFDATPFLKVDDWNTYEVVAVGGKILTAINGHPCTSIDDDQVAKEGIFGLQIHSGGPTEVRFKDFELELDPKAELKTVKQ